MTILETVVWIALFAMAMLAITSMALYFYRTSRYAIQESQAVSSAQSGIDDLVSDLREATYASNGAYPLVSIAPNDIVFYANVDTDQQIERVHYYVQGTTLYRGVLDPSGDPSVYTGTETVSVISQYVHNLDQNTSVFTYFDTSGNQIADYTKFGSARFVTVNLVVDVDTNRIPTMTTLRSSAALRNLVGH